MQTEPCPQGAPGKTDVLGHAADVSSAHADMGGLSLPGREVSGQRGFPGALESGQFRVGFS